MGWAKFDDRYSEHPKVVAAGPLAELLDRRAIEYCARQETDGEMTEQQVRRMCADLVVDMGCDWRELVKSLTGVRRWHQTPDGYSVHDFLDYHPSHAEREAERAAARERMAKARSNKRKSSQEVQPNSTENVEGTSRYPDPVPLNTTPSSTDVDTDDLLRGFDEFWEVWPKRGGRKIGKSKAQDRWRKLTLDQRREAYKGAVNYAEASHAGHQGAMDAWRWLRDRLWEDFIEQAGPDTRRSLRDRPMTMLDGEEFGL